MPEEGVICWTRVGSSTIVSGDLVLRSIVLRSAEDIRGSCKNYGQLWFLRIGRELQGLCGPGWGNVNLNPGRFKPPRNTGPLGSSRMSPFTRHSTRSIKGCLIGATRLDVTQEPS